MARKPKNAPKTGPETGQGTTKQHNIGALNDVIKKALPEALQIKRERETLNARTGDIRTVLKDAGVDPKVFEFSLKVHEMEKEGQANWIDQLQINFEAMGVGSTDFYVQSADVGDEMLRKAKQAGADASFEGQKATANPHGPRQPERQAWQAGWLEQQAERAKEMAPKEPTDQDRNEQANKRMPKQKPATNGPKDEPEVTAAKKRGKMSRKPKKGAELPDFTEDGIPIIKVESPLPQSQPGTAETDADLANPTAVCEHGVPYADTCEKCEAGDSGS